MEGTKLFTILSEQGLIKRLQNPASEIESQLMSIRKMNKHGYQARYNLLFRYVSIYLAKMDFEFTRKTPHRTLQILCSQWFEPGEVAKMVKARHGLKYNNIKPDNHCTIMLEKLIINFGEMLNETLITDR